MGGVGVAETACAANAASGVGVGVATSQVAGTNPAVVVAVEGVVRTGGAVTSESRSGSVVTSQT